MIQRQSALLLAGLMALSVNLVGCEVVKGIFKAGVWFGVIAVALLIGIVAMVARSFSHR